jgi:hypothetical protein
VSAEAETPASGSPVDAPSPEGAKPVLPAGPGWIALLSVGGLAALVTLAAGPDGIVLAAVGLAIGLEIVDLIVGTPFLRRGLADPRATITPLMRFLAIGAVLRLAVVVAVVLAAHRYIEPSPGGAIAAFVVAFFVCHFALLGGWIYAVHRMQTQSADGDAG